MTPWKTIRTTALHPAPVRRRRPLSQPGYSALGRHACLAVARAVHRLLLGCAIKYLARFNAKAAGKGGLPDLLKARHYLDQLIALEQHE